KHQPKFFGREVPFEPQLACPGAGPATGGFAITGVVGLDALGYFSEVVALLSFCELADRQHRLRPHFAPGTVAAAVAVEGRWPGFRNGKSPRVTVCGRWGQG